MTLDGSGSDANGDNLTFAWSQTAGTLVVLANSDSAQASFTAPDVTAANPATLTFELTVSDGRAASTDTVVITVEEPVPTVTVAGTVSYEFVPPNANCAGLNLNPAFRQVRPIRGATVRLLESGGGVLATTVSDDTGAYSFANIDANAMVRLQVRAELKRSGSPGWDVDIRDNVDTSPSPVALPMRPLYVVESSDFDTEATPTRVFNMTAEAGWTGTSYGDPRAAAPFAILDAIYSAMQFVLAVDPTAEFPPLDAFWSVNNTTDFAGSSDLDAGRFSASFYSSDPDRDASRNPSLFLLGDANDDTEEFDDHVVVHEWGHYFEDTFSRSNSPGGTHFLGDRLDARLAFGEGWGHAIAAMVLNDPQYCDTGAPGTMAGFGFNAEAGFFGGQGWYDEISVLRFIYDLWDTDSEGTDTGSIGFEPIYEIMTGPQTTADAFTTVFLFAAELRTRLDAAGASLLDAQLGDEQIDAAVLNIWGDGETNDGGALSPDDVLPIYIDHTAGAAPVNVCSDSQFDPRGDGNKLSQFRYIRLNVADSGRYDVTITSTTLPDPDIASDSDPDMVIVGNGGFVGIGQSFAANVELFRTTDLAVGTYAADLRDFRFSDPNRASNYPNEVCFDVSFERVP